MYLTKEEERVYDGEYGWTLQKAMQILVAIGDLNDAERLIEIESAHVSGASYKTIGDAYEFIANLDGKVAVKTTLNPIGMDMKRWREMGISEDFAAKQRAVLSAYERLGIRTECTCIPYEISPPSENSHIAWSESSAVLFANSVLAARTNLEGAPSALAAALIGKTPLYGLHIPENRAAKVKIRVLAEISDADLGALGILIGKIARDNIPLLELQSPSLEISELKQLAAGIGATGAIGMFHVKNVTPEANDFEISEVIDVERSDIEEVCDACCEPDVIAIGCPHCGFSELKRIYEIMKRESARTRRNKVRRELFIFTARSLIRDGSGNNSKNDSENSNKNSNKKSSNRSESKAEMRKIVEGIERFGAKVFCDTCFVVSPAFEHFSCILTNSGKMMHYVRLMRGSGELSVRRGTEMSTRRSEKASVMLKSTEECVKAAFE